jgi:catechol 1,2-dioxygenase
MDYISSPPKLITKEADVTPTVLAAMANTDNPRLKEVMTVLVEHLHQFILKTRPTEEEFEYALRWIVEIGQLTNEFHNEVVLAADVVGASTLIDLINNDGMQGETMSALLGPFYRGGAPICTNGDCIARSQTPGATLFFSGRVIGVDGAPVAGAVLDVWQASPVGLYENQDETQEDCNLRGKFTSEADGRYHFRSVKPAGYPVPTDGPVGVLLRAQKREADAAGACSFHRFSAGAQDPDHADLFRYARGAGSRCRVRCQATDRRGTSSCIPSRIPIIRTRACPSTPAKYDFKLVPGKSTMPVPPISGKKS